MAFTPVRGDLSEPAFFILLSLAPGPKHGYAIMQEAAALSQGQVRLSVSTLYGALDRLLAQRLIRRVPARGAPGDSGRHPGLPRKAYALTPLGRKALAGHLHRLECLVRAARLKLGEAS